MPELPEVETVARGVHARVRGDRIVDYWFASHPQPFKNPPRRQGRGLMNRVIVAVHRTGKHIVCELSAAGASVAEAETAPPAANPQTRSAGCAEAGRRSPSATGSLHTNGAVR